MKKWIGVALVVLAATSGCGRKGQAFMQGLSEGLEQQSDPTGYQLRQIQRQQQYYQQQQLWQQQQIINQMNRPRTCYTSRYGYSATTTCY